ncbi:MAG: rhodanese-like domain-containing protein [Planctomycetes bacterium]|nr:rhodanese-like domain-containing protein [Planctomycetota bacterium]
MPAPATSARTAPRSRAAGTLRVVAAALGILAVAATLGLTTNALRREGHLDLGRTYFAAALPSSDGPRGPGANLPGTVPDGSGGTRSGPTPGSVAARAAAEFTVLDSRQTRALWDAAQTDPGDLLFVDARDREHFAAGHLPGALHLDYFDLADAIAPVRPFLDGIRWLVVYCESAQCDDGLQLCRALVRDHGIARDRLLLYVGGMQEWRTEGYPEVRR